MTDTSSITKELIERACPEAKDIRINNGPAIIADWYETRIVKVQGQGTVAERMVGSLFSVKYEDEVLRVFEWDREQQDNLETERSKAICEKLKEAMK